MTPDLVMIPGFMGQASDFDELVKILSPAIRCHVIELVGLTPEQDHSFIDAVEFWLTSISANLPKTFYLYGYSQGGRLAMTIEDCLNRLSPQRVRALFLESAHPGLNCRHIRQQRLSSDAQWAKRFRKAKKEHALGVLLRDWYAQAVFNNLNQQQIDALIGSKLRLDSEQLAMQLEIFGLGRQPDYSTVIARLPIPVYYFSGQLDKKFTDIGAALKGVDHCIAPAGHNIHFEQPQWLASHIARLVQDNVNKV